MSNICYVIYAICKDKETEEVEGVIMISCVNTEEEVQEYFDHMASKYNTEYINDCMIRVSDERCSFVKYITYQMAINNLDGGIKK